MGGNPRYRLWTRDNWQGYAPTIGRMLDHGWSFTIHCSSCRLGLVVDHHKIVRVKGRDWSPWGKSASCPAIGCLGRMRLKAYAPGPNEFIGI
ncbi:MAG: hypothetical protein EON59_04955 [Alphaproteobacteria bacterium]|nr:MAG: hypothetical protein EON59_04955 [Alphaproteobacteria bacterium]